MEVGIKENRVVAIRGIEDYPVNRGVLCLKGLSLMYVVHSEERGTVPLVRKGDAYAETSWDTSLNLVASKIKEIRDKHGPEALGMYLGAQGFTEEFYVANKLFKGYLGSNNMEANARLCMASAVMGCQIKSPCREEIKAPHSPSCQKPRALIGYLMNGRP